MTNEQIIKKQRELIESLLYGIDEAVSTIHYKRHDKTAMELCKSDLRELSLVISQEVDKLTGQTT